MLAVCISCMIVSISVVSNMFGVDLAISFEQLVKGIQLMVLLCLFLSVYCQFNSLV